MSVSLAARPPAVALPLPLPPKVSTRSSVDSRHSAFQTWLLADAACSSPEEVVEEEAEETEELGVLQGSLTPQVSPSEFCPFDFDEGTGLTICTALCCRSRPQR